MSESLNNEILKEVILMDERVSKIEFQVNKVESQVSSIDSKLTQVVDALLGNALTKEGGFVEEVRSLKLRVFTLEEKLKLQSDYQKKIGWVIGLVVGVALITEYVVKLYVLLK
jgi:hypothetical protein